MPTGRTVDPYAARVWDGATRIVHWSLAAAVLTAWATGQEGGASALHMAAGKLVLALVVFRVIWGFVGGEHARFASFLDPRAVPGHLAGVLRGRPERDVGHNPLGGLAVIALLTLAAATAMLGLFSAGEARPGGPLAPMLGGAGAGELHAAAGDVLLVLICAHVLAVVAMMMLTGDNLIGAMIGGGKTTKEALAAGDALTASRRALVMTAILGAGIFAGLLAMPASDPRAPSGASTGEHHERDDDEHEKGER